MAARHPVRFLVVLSAAAVAAAGGTACSTSRPAAHRASATAPATSTSAAAASSLQRAAAAMQATPGYRFSGHVRSGAATTAVAGEYQAPDRIHEVITAPNGSTAEVVFVGGQAYLKGASGWSKPAASTVSRQGDPRVAFSALRQAVGVSATGSSLAFDLPPDAMAQLVSSGPAPGSAHGVATLSAGGIAHLGFSFTEQGAPIEVSLDYNDIGNAPAVQTPIA